VRKAGESVAHRIEKVQHDIMQQWRHARYGIMAFGTLFFVAFLVITGPIWMMLLMFNLPVIITLYLTFFYTNVSLLFKFMNTAL